VNIALLVRECKRFGWMEANEADPPVSVRERLAHEETSEHTIDPIEVQNIRCRNF